MKISVGRRRHGRRGRRVLSRWTPRALVRRTVVRLTKWELHLMAWGMRMTARRALHALVPTAVRRRV